MAAGHYDDGFSKQGTQGAAHLLFVVHRAPGPRAACKQEHAHLRTIRRRADLQAKASHVRKVINEFFELFKT